MKFTLYPHGGSGNHGCEAIIRSTTKLLPDSDITLFSTNPGQDIEVGLDTICTVKKAESPIIPYSLDHIKATIKAKIFRDQEAYDKVVFKQILLAARKSDYFLSIGGDNYCYGANKYIYLVNKLVDKIGTKRILWGASVEPDSLKGELLEDLRGFHKIWARESLTYQALVEKGLSQTVLMPDPAFILERKDLPLPKEFIEGNTVGINISPMILGYEKEKGITLENYERLINYILEQTNMNIAMIPHVIWEHNDDRIPLSILYNKYKHTGRVCTLSNHNAEELKGFIARCRFMVVARTHASIAAYSSQVPTIVIGYSIKAKGIATDLFGTDSNYVIPVQSLKQANSLVDSFKWLINNEDDIKKRYKNIMEDYISQISFSYLSK